MVEPTPLSLRLRVKDLEHRLDKLEGEHNRLLAQNIVLKRRVDDLEARHPDYFGGGHTFPFNPPPAAPTVTPAPGPYSPNPFYTPLPFTPNYPTIVCGTMTGVVR